MFFRFWLKRTSRSFHQLICGMLNSNKGGTIHFGIHESGRIDGVRVNHGQRDGFRSGKRVEIIDELKY